MEITRPPVKVGIFGTEALSLVECADELQQAGYALNFSSSVKSLNNSDDDIFIVGMSEFDDTENVALCRESLSPFLISGIDSFPHNITVLDMLSSAVGYIRSTPTLTEILLNLRLGLHWHNERVSHSNRISDIETKIENNRIIGIAVGVLMNSYGESEQSVFDSLKTISRNKQRRLPSVADEVIKKHTEQHLKSPTSSLQAWLTDNITVKQR